MKIHCPKCGLRYETTEQSHECPHKIPRVVIDDAYTDAYGDGE